MTWGVEYPAAQDLSLGDRQRLLVHLLPKLIQRIEAEGYSATLGDAYRDPRVFGKYGEKVAYSASKSLHKKRLAIDLNLFDSHGKYLTTTEDHAPFGQFWQSLHPLCEWGGAGDRNDGNHYSIRWQGRW